MRGEEKVGEVEEKSIRGGNISALFFKQYFEDSSFIVPKYQYNEQDYRTVFPICINSIHG